MPLISFIIPAYNIPEELLLECMESVMKLNLQPHERQIVVVDDGSEKPVEPLIRKCFGDDVKVVRQQNQGLSAARNVGMELATAQYIQFLDADDALLTNQYNDCIRVLKEKKPDILRFDYNKTSKDCRPNMKVK